MEKILRNLDEAEVTQTETCGLGSVFAKAIRRGTTLGLMTETHLTSESTGCPEFNTTYFLNITPLGRTYLELKLI